MADGSRIPRGIDEFNPYVILTVPYMQTGSPTNAARLNISVTEVGQMQSLYAQWQPLYLKYCDKRNSRTTAVVEQLKMIIRKFIDLDLSCHILDRIAASPAVTITDLETFNIKSGPLKKMTKTIQKTAIQETVVVSIVPIGGGTVSIKCRSVSGNRAGIIDGADSVQFCYSMGPTAPDGADKDGQRKEISTKASFLLPLGADASSKIVYLYFRWYNTKHPEISGPWSSLMMTLVL